MQQFAKTFGKGFVLAVAASTIVGAMGASFIAKAMETGTTSAKPPENVTPCKSECYFQFGECNKAAGDNAEARMACKTAGNACLGACAASGEKPPAPKEVPPCHAECYKAFGECNKEAGEDQEARMACKSAGNECLAKCPAATGKTTSDKEKAYQAAVAAAKQKYLEGQKKLLEQYTHDLEKAWKMKMGQ